MFKTMILVFSVLVLCACGAKVSGKYVGQGPLASSSFTFKENGKVVIENIGIKAEVPYEVDGDHIKMMAMGGVTVTLNKDGSFNLPGAGKYVKE